jgi:hypothetical protein
MSADARQQTLPKSPPVCPLGCEGTPEFRERRNREAVWRFLSCGISFSVLVAGPRGESKA